MFWYKLARLQHHDGDGSFSPVGIGTGDDRRLGHGVVAHHDVFQVRDIDVDPAADDRVLGPVDDVDIALSSFSGSPPCFAAPSRVPDAGCSFAEPAPFLGNHAGVIAEGGRQRPPGTVRVMLTASELSGGKAPQPARRAADRMIREMVLMRRSSTPRLASGSHGESDVGCSEARAAALRAFTRR